MFVIVIMIIALIIIVFMLIVFMKINYLVIMNYDMSKHIPQNCQKYSNALSTDYDQHETLIIKQNIYQLLLQHFVLEHGTF